MKKSIHFEIKISFLICLLNVFPTIGQTITCQTSCPKAGELFSIRTSSPVLNSAGANQVWNFSAILAVSSSTYLTTYGTANSVPSASLYPGADIVCTTFAGTTFSANTFLKVGDEGVRLASSMAENVNVEAMRLPFPLAFGDTYTETAISTTVSGTDTFVATSQNTFAAHGSGTLILPSGTYPNVIAIKYKSILSRTKNGSPFGYIYYNTSYYYYSQYISHHLMYSRQLSESGPADYGPYTEFIDHIVVGLEEEYAEGKEMVISPNPASDIVNIRFSTGTRGTVILANSIGQELMQQNYFEGNCQLNITTLSRGIYVISVFTDGKILRRKLLVSR